MNRKCAGASSGEPGEMHRLKLEWEHIVTRTDTTEATGEVYQAAMKGDFTGEITLRIGRHPGWPRTWHVLAECGERAKKTSSEMYPGRCR